MSRGWTWDRFKAEMELAGVKGDDRIAWIDWSGPSDSVKIRHRIDGALEITAAHHYEEIDDGE